MAVTLQQIAAESGVSVPTASRILRGEGHLHRPETCRRVMEIARRLDYRPNFFSRALVHGKSMSVGLLTHSGPSRHAQSRVRRFTLRARDQGYLTYQMMTHRRQRDAQQVAAAIQELLDRRVDGLVIQRSIPMASEVHELLERLRVPVVYVGWAPADHPHCVRVDHQPGIDALADHLVGLGHQRVAFFSGIYSTDYLGHKITPYRRAFARHDIELIRAPVTAGDDEDAPETQAHAAVATCLAQRTDVTALLMNNDESAIGALAAVREAGRRVPEDVSVVGFDDLGLARMVDPPLTTIRAPGGEVGEAAFDLLHRCMSEPHGQIEPITYTSELIIRDSTAPAPA